MTLRIGSALLLFLSGCQAADWRSQVIDHAEQLLRSEVSDPAARFSRVQVTGDDRTGQSCGFVTARASPTASEKTGRFIVYIDATAGPFVENGMGSRPMAKDDFDRSWQADCVREGYAA